MAEDFKQEFSQLVALTIYQDDVLLLYLARQLGAESTAVKSI